MSEVLTATELARRFGDVLAEVRHTGKAIPVTKNGQPVAELRPFDSPKTCSLREFAEAWEGRMNHRMMPLPMICVSPARQSFTVIGC